MTQSNDNYRCPEDDLRSSLAQRGHERLVGSKTARVVEGFEHISVTQLEALDRAQNVDELDVEKDVF